MSQSQPHGTVTFLFTDIERSTQLLSDLGTERYAAVLDRHGELLQATLTAHAGYEVDYEADSFLILFKQPLQALRCCIAGVSRWLDGMCPRGTQALRRSVPELAVSP